MTRAKYRGSPCEPAWEWIEDKKFKTKEDALKYARNSGGNEYVKHCIEEYPWDEEPPKPPEEPTKSEIVQRTIEQSDRVLHPKEIADITGLKHGTVGRIVRELTKADKVVCTKRGCYIGK